MDRIIEILLADIRHLLHDLGKGGGVMSPSIYDTSQALRWAPPSEGPGPAIEWLLGEQQPDGGWGNPVIRHARDEPTLAAILALHKYGKSARERTAILNGLEFLKRQEVYWRGPLPEDLPVGMELILPGLLDEANQLGLEVSRAPYEALIALGQRRRKMLARVRLRPGTTPAHSWELLGVPPDLAMIDGSKGVGYSPAATAAWMNAAASHPELADARAGARQYLEAAAAATCSGIPGLLPTAWPMDHFELAFSLYAVLVAGLLDHPGLRDALRPKLDELAGAMTPEGLGFSDDFAPDGDDTAAAMAVLKATGRPVELSALTRFAHEDHYCAYVGELQPAVSATAHAVHALTLLGQDVSAARGYILARQPADGRWVVDKWNGSWLYTTSQVLVALEGTRHEGIDKAIHALMTHQHPDGGWGIHASSAEETAYGVLALRTLLRQGALDESARRALLRAEQWMREDYRPFALSQNKLWLAKEMYRPYRIVRMFELVATMPREALSPLSG